MSFLALSGILRVKREFHLGGQAHINLSHPPFHGADVPSTEGSSVSHTVMRQIIIASDSAPGAVFGDLDTTVGSLHGLPAYLVHLRDLTLKTEPLSTQTGAKWMSTYLILTFPVML